MAGIAWPLAGLDASGFAGRSGHSAKLRSGQVRPSQPSVEQLIQLVTPDTIVHLVRCGHVDGLSWILRTRNCEQRSEDSVSAESLQFRGLYRAIYDTCKLEGSVMSHSVQSEPDEDLMPDGRPLHAATPEERAALVREAHRNALERAQEEGAACRKREAAITMPSWLPRSFLCRTES
jgi:hypothetical protein